MSDQTLKNSVLKASHVVGKTWPLYSFVTSNPLTGYETMPFKTAVNHAANYLGAKVYPEASVFRAAWAKQDIDKEILSTLLSQNNLKGTPEHYLNLIDTETSKVLLNKSRDLDRILSKWLGAFMDEGIAEWSIPNKNMGFFNAWKQLVRYDKETKVLFRESIPHSSEETLKLILFPYTDKEITAIFSHHLAALPGWVGYIKHRTENNTYWQQEFPIDLMDYLAVRLWIAKSMNYTIYDASWEYQNENEISEVKYLFLKAWESTWQKSMSNTIKTEANKTKHKNYASADAQMVFCIDTRSELIRRHVESAGNYETFGYAGFFGIATDYEDLETGIVRKSCPPILASSYLTSENPHDHKSEKVKDYNKGNDINKFKNYFLKRLKNMLPSAFGFVEGTGIFYGISMLFRTLLPGKGSEIKLNEKPQVEHICEPKINPVNNITATGISLEEKVGIVKSAFDLLGWKHFAPVIVFAGHGSHSANNPFASSLDCGACAASPGRHNARLLAKLANDKELRQTLKKEYNINIPEGTIFLGAEHNTTTDDIVLFDSETPEQFKDAISILKFNLKQAQESATQERLSLKSNATKEAIKRSQNWSETRPEWGLAKNVGFVIGSRELTKDVNLRGKCFLHSYDWREDSEGKALEGIMQGPMVVTQWINNHYYFSTVDNKVLGGGNKISHNVIGQFGVVQGNGGDLKIGLPLQSVNATDKSSYHDPLRLSVMIHAPVQRVSRILLKNENLKQLLDNEWIYLLVMNPKNSNDVYKYEKNLNWVSTGSKNPNPTKTSIKAKDFELEEALI